MGQGWPWHGVPDPKPGPLHSPRLPPRRAHCQMELQPDIWGRCQTTTEPIFPFIKRGRGELPEPWEGGRVSLQRPRPENPCCSLPGLLLASFLGLPWLWGLRLYLCVERRHCLSFPLRGNSTCTEWRWALFQMLLHRFVSSQGTPWLQGEGRARGGRCLRVLLLPYCRWKNRAQGTLEAGQGTQRVLASQPLFRLKGLARLPWGGGNSAT